MKFHKGSKIVVKDSKIDCVNPGEITSACSSSITVKWPCGDVGIYSVWSLKEGTYEIIL